MRYLLYILFFILSSNLFGQNKNLGLLAKFSYSIHTSAGDLGDRFGLHYSPGIQLDYRINNKITFGPEFNFQFGNKVKDDVIEPLRDNLGLIIGENTVSSEVFLRQRGTYLGLNFGLLNKIGQIKSGNFLHTQFSIGHWQHKIRIIDDTNSAAQIRGDYIKLYDRLTNGLALKQVVGLTHLSTRNATNYFIQLEIMEGFTENRRNWDAILQAKDNTKRIDISIGFRIGWILPLFNNVATIKGEDIFY